VISQTLAEQGDCKLLETEKRDQRAGGLVKNLMTKDNMKEIDTFLDMLKMEVDHLYHHNEPLGDYWSKVLANVEVYVYY
jgi:hypothetical protein